MRWMLLRRPKEARRADFFPAEEVSREQVRWQRGEEELGEVDELRLALHRDPGNGNHKSGRKFV